MTNNSDKVETYYSRNKERLRAQAKITQKAFYEKNKDLIKSRHKEYVKENSDKLKAARVATYEKNRAKVAASAKLYNDAHKVESSARGKLLYQRKRKQIAEYGKSYYVRNREVIKKRISGKFSKRYNEDELFRRVFKMRHKVVHAIKMIKLGRKTRTEHTFGCDDIKLKHHIESQFQPGMTWGNHGEWQVDHIRPVCLFTIEDLHTMNHFTNLQPLWKSDNIAKGNTHL